MKQRISVAAIVNSILTLLLFSASLYGQRKDEGVQQGDSLAVIKEFLQICQIYKTVPLQLDLEFRNTASFVSSEQDTANYSAKFFLTNEASYVQFGEVEQLVTGSAALIVSNKMKRMTIYSNPQPFAAQMQQLVNLQMTDSSALGLSRKFKAFPRQINNDTVNIELHSRNVMYGTLLSRETIILSFSAKRKEPYSVVTVKRTLIPLSKEDHDNLSKDAAARDKLLTVREGEYFLVKEQQSLFMFNSIKHEELKVPVTVSDRVVKNSKGEYEPARGYEGYQLIVN